MSCFPTNTAMTNHKNLGANQHKQNWFPLVRTRPNLALQSSRLRDCRVYTCRMCSQRMAWFLDALREEKTWGHEDRFSWFVLHGCGRCDQCASYLFLVGSCKGKALKSQQFQLRFREMKVFTTRIYELLLIL